MAMWIMSDRTIPRSFRFMEGFGVHTFRLVNAEGKSTFVKFHWKPKLGMQSVVWNEAVKINGTDPDFHRRDLWDAIQMRRLPGMGAGAAAVRRGFCRQIRVRCARRDQAHPGGRRADKSRRAARARPCVDNFFAETEQVAFCTQNIVPGIDFTNDPLLQGRNFSYLDTQLKRLGSPNFTYLPINAPKCPFHIFSRTGTWRSPTRRAAPITSRTPGAPPPAARASRRTSASIPIRPRSRTRSDVSGRRPLPTITARRGSSIMSQTPVEQGHIAAAFTFELSKVETPAIRARMVSHLLNVDEVLAKKVADGLRLKEMPKAAEPARPVITSLKPSPALSMLGKPPGTFKGRKLGVLVSDGVDAALLRGVRDSFEKEGAVVKLVAPMVGGVEASDGTWIEADEKIDGGPSVVFDAVAVLLSDAGAQLLAGESTARDFVADAFAHCKFIAHSAAAQPLLDKAGVVPDAGVIALAKAPDVTAFVKECGKLRFWERETQVKRV